MKRLLVCLLLVGVVGCKKDEYDPSMNAPAPENINQQILESLQGRQRPGMPGHGSAGKSNNPFMDAVVKGDIEAVKKHLADGADVNIGNPLNIAIESKSARRKDIVELLLAKGSDVNAKNDRGWTPAESLQRTAGAMMLVGATDEELAANNEIAGLLLEHGAQTEADFKQFFPDAAPGPAAEPETHVPTPPEDE